MSMISDLVKKLRWIADYEYQNRNSEVTIRKAADTIEMLSKKARATKQEWIPCSERLPEEKEVVAVIIKRWDTGEIKKGITHRVDHNLWVGFGRHNEACVWWLPLPPWKGADDGSR